MFRIVFLFSCLLTIKSVSLAQSTREIKNLVFEGAGIRGIAYCGALQEMESHGMMLPIQRVAGTSAGAIMAMAVSLGYSSAEVANIIGGTNFKSFNDGRYFFIGGINRVNKYFGWYRSNKFDQWIGKLIDTKTGNADITFLELHQRNFKDLYITGTCLNKQKPVLFSFETYPNMRIRDAVRISMSIPLYFEAVFLDKNGQIVNHPSNKQDLDVMVDGGFTGNFPIHVFDSTRYQACFDSNQFVHNFQTIGFRIDSDAQIKKDSTGAELAELPINNLKNYLGAFYNIVIENLNRQSLTNSDWARTVSISDGGIGPRLRKLSKKDIEVLMENGRVAINKHLDQL